MSIIEVPSLYAAEIIENRGRSMLIDVRTPEEWQNSGIPKVNMQSLLLLPWQLSGSGELNPEFENEIKARISDRYLDLFFICRSGGRSHAAARFVNNLGYAACYNIVDGFEGIDSTNGWKNNKLPIQVFSENA
jgi:rhodanese-related sulfurtransferase